LVVSGVNRWTSRAKIKGEVAASAAFFPRGFLGSEVTFANEISDKLFNAGMPSETARAFGAAVWEAWNDWAKNLSAPPSPVAFPSFAAFPGALAPPTLATTSTLPLLGALATPSAELGLGKEALARSIKTRLGAASSQPGAEAGINDFAQWFSGRFVSWRSKATIAKIMGGGPVPTFAPPSVPVGPVRGTWTGTLNGPAF